MPGWPPAPPAGTGTVLLPPIHVHWLVDGVNFHRSLRKPVFPLASRPAPPKSQKLPLLSVQLTAEKREPGVLPAAGTPNVPYTAVREWVFPAVLLPAIQVHRPEEGSNSQRSLSMPQLPLPSYPSPPKSKRLPLRSE